MSAFPKTGQFLKLDFQNQFHNFVETDFYFDPMASAT
jgi:hypothetical protein